LAVGLNTGHHHPDIFHDGDAPRKDSDWGLAQLDTVRDRTVISGVRTYEKVKNGRIFTQIDASESSTFLHRLMVLTNFGHHALHHLFPAIDHYHLPKLYPVLEQTMNEFGEVFKTDSAWNLIIGQFRQLARVDSNIVPPGPKLT
jgi:hypothetical protein